MSNTIKITCNISTTDPTAKLGMMIWLDRTLIANYDHVDSTIEFSHDMSDVDSEHQLAFVMKNKLPGHTKIDENGAILDDACLIISNLTFDEIELGQVFSDQAKYTHNFNSDGPDTTESFYGTMGCNGTVTLDFSSPVYLWLLENM